MIEKMAEAKDNMTKKNSAPVIILFIFKELLLGISLFSFFMELNTLFIIFSIGSLYCICEILDYMKGYKSSLHSFYVTTIVFLSTLIACLIFHSLTKLFYGASIFFIGSKLGIHLSGKNTLSTNTSEKENTKKESDIAQNNFKIIFRVILSFIYVIITVILIKFIIYDYIYNITLLKTKIYAIIILFTISLCYSIFASYLEKKLFTSKFKNIIYTSYNFWYPFSLLLVTFNLYYFSIK
ncbi:hypothetical protein [Anaerovorax odorimutans]|uniref:hypothetical protein n=1 Tax=Anaerovorax odorimutans TaxID=109327 RepID=UPI0004813D71|nr:hypothetical protein [Anaerovorax odorimutans]